MLCLPRSRKRLPSLCILDYPLHCAGSEQSSLVRKHGGDSIADVRALSVFLRMRLVPLCLRCFLADRTKRIDGAAMLWEQMMLCLTL